MQAFDLYGEGQFVLNRGWIYQVLYATPVDQVHTVPYS
jgi:hypothetical protein